MHCRRVILVSTALICAGIVGCGSESGEDGVALVKVGSRVFYESDLDERLEQMSPMSRAQFEGIDGRRTLLGRLVEEEAFFQAAEQGGFAKDAQVIEEVERSRRSAMLRAYYNQEIRDKAKPSGQEIEEYYRSNLEEFRTEPRVRIRHVLVKTRAKAESVRERAVMGRDFDQLASTYSIDEKTKDKGGLIPGYVSAGKQVPLLGNLDPLVEAAIALSEEGEVGPVVETNLGFHVIKAEEVHPGGLIPLEDVRGQIERREMERRAKELYDLQFMELTERLNIRYFEDAEPPTVEELFNSAQNAKAPKERIRQYERILQTYPDNPRAYEAQFMIGFTYSEELENFSRAKMAFEAVLNNYPECDLAQSARWMLENLGQEEVPMEGLNLPPHVVRKKD
jgi:peptidyl-prolyl cis-trans isomerase C